MHDELIFEMPRALFPYLDKIIRDIDYLMTTYDEINVRLDVGNKLSAYSWADAKDYEVLEAA